LKSFTYASRISFTFCEPSYDTTFWRRAVDFLAQIDSARRRPILEKYGEEAAFPIYRWGDEKDAAPHQLTIRPALFPMFAQGKESLMLFISLGNVRAGTDKERIARRMQWSYPPGLKLVAEYWLMTDKPKLISIAEADDISAILAATSQWDDVFSFRVVPAVTAEQGLALAKKMMQ
jgi:hypothetical protein